MRSTPGDGTTCGTAGVLTGVQGGATGLRPGTGQRPPVAPPRGVPAPVVHRALRIAGVLLLVGYLGFMAWWALRPDPNAWMQDTNLTPFASVREDLADGGTGYLTLVRGLLVAAPLGVLLPLAGGRVDVSPLASCLRTTAGGVLLATGLEVLETAGAGKVLDVDDIILAALGVLLAHLAVVPAARAGLRRRRRHRGEAGPAAAHPARNSHSDLSAA